MQGLRPFVQQQDENSVAHLHRGLSGKTFGGEASLGRGGAALPGARKALGGLGGRGLDAENAAPAKTPAAAGPRRALGDITNNAHAKSLQQAQPAAAQKPAAVVRPAAAARPASRAEALAEQGAERLAGKGWQEQEEERQQCADAEIDERLLAFAALGKRSLPTFFPLWAPKIPATSLQAPLQREVLPVLPPSPCPAQQQHQGPPLDLGLEDLELPEISFALPGDDDFLG